MVVQTASLHKSFSHSTGSSKQKAMMIQTSNPRGQFRSLIRNDNRGLMIFFGVVAALCLFLLMKYRNSSAENENLLLEKSQLIEQFEDLKLEKRGIY